MTVVFDILHPAHINLFKHSIRSLFREGIDVIVICIDRGKLPEICRDELSGIEIHVIGKHRNKKLSIIFESNLLRFLALAKFLLFRKVDLGISFGSFLLGAILRIKRVRNIHLSDDPERKVNAYLELLTCTERYMPPIVQESGKTKIFNALKEWAYLSPNYFINDEQVLRKYDLQKKGYVFVREVSTGSLNYSGQPSGLIASISAKIPSNIPVILSLEDKRIIDDYPKHWKIINEPEGKIHSIIFNSLIVLSSGDSMAREGAMLGVPSIYCGKREMAANELLIRKGMLWHLHIDSVVDMVTQFWNGDIPFPSPIEFRNELLGNWTDVNELIIQLSKKDL